MNNDSKKPLNENDCVVKIGDQTLKPVSENESRMVVSEGFFAHVKMAVTVPGTQRQIEVQTIGFILTSQLGDLSHWVGAPMKASFNGVPPQSTPRSH